MMVDNQALLNEKQGHLQDMFDRLAAWDRTADSAQAILDHNQTHIQAIETIDRQLSRDEREAFVETHRGLVEDMLAIQRRLIAVLQKESKKIEGQMQQMNKKDKVVRHYMDKETSLFVDRDV